MTRDGVHVALHLNAGLLVDLPHIAETGADGIGLFRTELQFMMAAAFPRSGEQQRLYRAVLDAAGDRPVTFRTLDIGGDKVLPYMRPVEEENPALGWRAIRIGLDRPGLLRSQVRAMLKAAAGRDLRLMFPMVADVDEFERARAIVERELAHLRRHGYLLPEQLQLGVMVEVPSLLFELDELFARTDFLSVGSNDLMQFLFAADRENPRVSDRFDPLSVPVLRALKRIIDSGQAHGMPVTLCGELASQPLDAMALLALGYRSLSMSAASIGPVKAMLRHLDAQRAAQRILPWLEGCCSDTGLRERLHAFAVSEALPL